MHGACVHEGVMEEMHSETGLVEKCVSEKFDGLPVAFAETVGILMANWGKADIETLRDTVVDKLLGGKLGAGIGADKLKARRKFKTL